MDSLQQWILIGFGFYCIIMFLSIIFFSLRRRGKIAIRVITSLGRITRWVKPNFEGNKIYVLIRKENKRKQIPEWKAEITQVLDFPLWFFRRGKEAYIMPEAEKTVTFDFEGKHIEQPMYDKYTEYGFIQAKAIEQEGEGEKPSIPMWILYVTLLVCFAAAFISLLIYLKLGRL